MPVTANSFSHLHVSQLSTALQGRRNRESADVTFTWALSKSRLRDMLEWSTTDRVAI